MGSKRDDRRSRRDDGPDDDGPSFADFMADPIGFIRDVVDDALDDVDYTHDDGGDDDGDRTPPAKPRSTRRRRDPEPPPAPKRRGFFGEPRD